MNTEPEKDKGAERRRAPRIKGAIVEYAVGENDFKQPAFIKDISITGVCIYVYEAIEEGSLLRLKIHLFGVTEPVTTNGKVVWRKKSGYLDYHDLGIILEGINDENKKRLAEYIEAHLSEEEMD